MEELHFEFDFIAFTKWMQAPHQTTIGLTLFLPTLDPTIPNLLTLFFSGRYQTDACLPFSLYLLHGFCSEYEQPNRNRVKLPQKTKMALLVLLVSSLSANISDSRMQVSFEQLLEINPYVHLQYKKNILSSHQKDNAREISASRTYKSSSS